jgi:hypothetical protein
MVLAVPAAWVLFGTPVRADYIGPQVAVRGESGFGASSTATDDAASPDRYKKDESLVDLNKLLLPLGDRGPSTRGGASGAGVTGASGPGGSASQAGLLTRPPVPILEPAGRLLGAYATYHPPPFTSGIFHPPRAA